MDDKQRLQLQKMISANNVEDQTDLIRNLKHSHVFKSEIKTMMMLKEKYRGDDEKIREECMNDCGFLFTYYTDLFNKIRKDEIDLSILFKFIEVLRKIEDGEVDQHEGSFMVGTLLKELYIDSALKKADKLDEQYSTEDPVKKEPIVSISWKQFKQLSKK
jgi:hypothetical protein